MNRDYPPRYMLWEFIASLRFEEVEKEVAVPEVLFRLPSPNKKKILYCRLYE